MMINQTLCYHLSKISVMKMNNYYRLRSKNLPLVLLSIVIITLLYIICEISDNNERLKLENSKLEYLNSII